MGLSYRKRVKIGDDTYANISKSGVSISKKAGNVTLNSKRGVTVNLGNGVVFRPGKKNNKSNGTNNFFQLMLMQQMMNNTSYNSKEQKSKKNKKSGGKSKK